MRNVYIMSGIPGSGKSTWMHQHAGIGDFMLSRDAFRASLRNQYASTKYFPVPEKEEWYRWTQAIIRHLQQFPDANVYIDQTTLTQYSATNLIRAISPGINADDNVIIVSILCNEKLALERNSRREGFERVPEKVIKDMNESRRKNPITVDKTIKSIKDLFATMPSVSIVYENMED